MSNDPRPPGPLTRNRGHGVANNDGIWNHAATHIVVRPILKVASTTLSHWLHGNGFLSAPFNARFPDDYIHAGLVRDVYPRYLSTLHSMYYIVKVTQASWEQFLVDVEEWNQHYERPWDYFDNPHFRPQVERVAQMTDPVLFPLEQLDDFRVWLIDQGVEIGEPPHRNPSDAGRSALATEIISRAIIEEHYAQDVQLWRTTRSTAWPSRS